MSRYYRITFSVKDTDDSWDVFGMLCWAFSGWPKFKIEEVEEIE